MHKLQVRNIFLTYSNVKFVFFFIGIGHEKQLITGYLQNSRSENRLLWLATAAWRWVAFPNLSQFVLFTKTLWFLSYRGQVSGFFFTYLFHFHTILQPKLLLEAIYKCVYAAISRTKKTGFIPTPFFHMQQHSLRTAKRLWRLSVKACVQFSNKTFHNSHFRDNTHNLKPCISIPFT